MNGNTQYIVDEEGHKRAVVMDIDSYEELLEDIESLALIADAKQEPTVSFEDVKKRLKASGRL